VLQEHILGQAPTPLGALVCPLLATCTACPCSAPPIWSVRPSRPGHLAGGTLAAAHHWSLGSPPPPEQRSLQATGGPFLCALSGHPSNMCSGRPRLSTCP